MATLNLPINNLYSKGYIVELVDNKSILKRDVIAYKPLVNKDKTHIVKDNEKIWELAYRYYRSSQFWYRIADANLLFNPFELTVNTQLLIPDADNFVN